MPTEELTPTPMALCDVTGKMYPEDELVVIHGQRVSAEGKAILMQRLQSGEALPGELETPSVWKRFVCIFLDGLILGIPFAILNAVVVGIMQSLTAVGLCSLVSVAVQIVYFGQMHAMKGQTVGKMAGNLKVVSLSGGPITTTQAYIRALAYAGPGALSGLATVIAGLTSQSMTARMQPNPLPAIAGVIVSVYALVNVIMALIDRTQQRALHDRIAGTRVIVKQP